MARSKFDRWSRRLGTPNQHNGRIPRDFWLEDWEKAKIIAFHDLYPLEGYRRLAYMMLDADVVAVSPSSVYRVLKAAGKLAARGGKAIQEGDKVSSSPCGLTSTGTSMSPTSISAGHSSSCAASSTATAGSIVHWEIRETMNEAEVETIIQRAREQFPGERPRIISDNGPQFIAKDFKEFIRICGMTHVKTSPYYPQSNGKMERWFKTLKGECIRVKTPLSLEDARRLVAEFVAHYNTVRLHSAIALHDAGRQAGGSSRADLGRPARETGDGPTPRRRAKANAKEGFAPRACWGTLGEPGRRIGQRGDATRAQTQVPRPGRAARCRPSASRDWPQCDKSIHSLCSSLTSLTSDGDCPIHAEPAQCVDARPRRRRS